MADTFRLPDIGEGLAEAEIVRWLVAVGDHVDVDEPVVEIETDKALMEIPSPYAGTVLSHGAPEGSVLEVGAVLVVIGQPGETVEGAADDRPDETSSTGADEVDVPDSAPIVGTISSDAVDLTDRGSSPDSLMASSSSRSVHTLPMIRRMAADLGVDLDRVEGTGPGGRITREDVRRAAETRGAPGALEPVPLAPLDAGQRERSDRAPSGIEPDGDDSDAPDAPTGPEEHGPGERLSATRRAIADHMQRSWREIPHVTTFERADAGRLLEAKHALERRHGVRFSVDALIVAAVTVALEAHPVVASRLEDDRIVTPASLDVGVAVDGPEGLVVVVVTEPASRDLVGLSAEIDRLAAAARDRRLSPQEMRGQCFTVSNIGAVGGWLGTPIVPYGTSGILSVGRAADEAVVRNGGVRVATMMPLSFSYDHRLIDGAEGRAFIGTVVENLEEPALFLA